MNIPVCSIEDEACIGEIQIVLTEWCMLVRDDVNWYKTIELPARRMRGPPRELAIR